jgi:Rrf2 family transcriptional regulator, iron-sulfur cluster assembly transcription factor
VLGPRGGYRLARRPREVRLAEVIEAVGEPPTPAEGAEPALGGALQGAVVAPLWAELDAALRERLGALTLEDLLRRAGAAGLRRPAAEPLNFAI